MNFLIRVLISTLAVLVTTYILRAGVHVDSFYTAVIVALVLGFMNAVVKPFLILFALPAIVFTFGLFLIVINTLIILLTDKLVDGFHVNGFWWALLFSIILWMVTGIFNAIRKRDEQVQQ